ncbi:glycosyltransferase family 2 protein [Salinigranum halophilum]|uniref:glycosyltransferase family 2 protein n=1 Tax=Salinigranum halophilum TaxID=2565931 RepID=UPI0010A83F1E|nr:glycosyltransferase family 2 protein [Salinigranum halophilum]
MSIKKSKKVAADEPNASNGLDTTGTLSGDELLLSEASSQQPSLSVVMPTLNEEEGIAECIQRVKNALEELQIYGEIVVSDSSTDDTPLIAEEMGARVISPDKKGYGYAYLFAFRHVRGDIIAMGDADTTYDFEELPKLFELVDSGEADMAMGSRLNGEILPGSMPKLHKYVGNPFLTKFLNFFYGAGVSDAHSGMRVFTRSAYEEMELQTTGMEFASEMIMKAGEKDLVIKELPITYHPRKGEAELESFKDGWRHVRFMLANAPGYLFSAPGLILAVTGVITMAIAGLGVSINGGTFGINSMIAGSLFTLVGTQVACFGAFATVAGEPIRKAEDPITNFLTTHVDLEHGAVAGLVVFAVSAAYMALVGFGWTSSGLVSPPVVVALTTLVLGIQLIFTSFFLGVLSE